MGIDKAFLEPLRSYLHSKLPKVYDSDVPALANYIIVILEHDKPIEELRDSCIEKLDEFLVDQTRPFVDELFKFIASNRPQGSSGGTAQASAGSASSGVSAGAAAPSSSTSRSRHRSGGGYSSEEDRDEDQQHERSFKRRRSRDDEVDESRRRTRDYSPQRRQGRGRDDNRARPQGRHGDRAPSGNRINTVDDRHAGKRKQKCRDFEFKGVCLRGDQCPYDHGTQVVVENVSSFPPGGKMPPVPVAGGARDVPYDPERASFDAGLPPHRHGPPMGPGAPGPAPGMMHPPAFGHAPPGHGFPPRMGRGWPNQGPPLPPPPHGFRNAGAPPPGPGGFAGPAPHMGMGMPPGGVSPMEAEGADVIDVMSRDRAFAPPPGDADGARGPGFGQWAGRGRPPRGGPGGPYPLGMPPMPPHLRGPPPMDRRMHPLPDNGAPHAGGPQGDGQGFMEPGGVAPMSGLEDPQQGQQFQQQQQGGRKVVRRRAAAGGPGQSAEGGADNFEHSASNLLIQNLPPEKNNVSDLAAYFSKFGQVENIRCLADSNRAFVKFRQPSEAQAAFQSPDPLFNNRFIRIAWARYDPRNPLQQQHKRPYTASGQQGDGSAGADGNGAQIGSDASRSAAPAKKIRLAKPGQSSMTLDLTQQGNEAGAGGAGTPVAAAGAVAELKQVQAKLLTKQIAAQKELLDMLSNKHLTAEQKSELKEKLKSLTAQMDVALKKTAAQTKAAVAAAAANAAPPVQPLTPRGSSKISKEDLDRELESLTQRSASNSASNPSAMSTDNEQASASGTDGDSSAAMLQAKLEQAKKEATELGLMDEHGNLLPEAVADLNSRGRGRGRGIRGSRGRGGMAVSVRGRGRGRGRGAAMASMQLDNRTTEIAVSGLPADKLNEDSLKAHFQAAGPVAGVTIDPSGVAVVRFADRRAAEKSLSLQKLPDGPALKMEWHEPVSQPNAASPGTHTSSIATPATAPDVVSSSTPVLTGEEPASERPVPELWDSDEEESRTEKSWKR